MCAVGAGVGASDSTTTVSVSLGSSVGAGVSIDSKLGVDVGNTGLGVPVGVGVGVLVDPGVDVGSAAPWRAIATQLVEAYSVSETASVALRDVLTTVDALITPTMTLVAPPHRQRASDHHSRSARNTLALETHS